jgi:ribulose-phosphate 3-epimerase
VVDLGPSILSADFLRLGEHLSELAAAGADYVHVDVMDGRFVPNISLGLPLLAAIRKGTALPLDVHLMIVEPERWVDAFADAGADRITVHAEASPHLHRLAEAIRARGKLAGVALNPSTPVSAIAPLLPFVDQVLVMTVNPGFGGQSFIPEMALKVAELRRVLERGGPQCTIQVDGGINRHTIGRVAQAGATSIVAGTAVFGEGGSIRDNLASLRAAAGGG